MSLPEPDKPFPAPMAQSSSHPESSEPTLSTNPTRPPFRQSTRVITPVKTHPLYIRPNNTPAGLWQVRVLPPKLDELRDPNQRDRKLRGPRRNHQKRKRAVVNNSDESSEANSDSGVAIMDLAQDSDEHNSKMEPPTKKTQGLAISEFDDVVLYFEPPERAKGHTKGKKLFYKCKWCPKTYKRGEHTRSNLRVHRDGGVGRSACPGRNTAIRTAGANLPKSWKDSPSREHSGFNQ
ncbi:hypothetical protein PSHT_13521 [Puccinia striiformis]|uniref:Uncharacterized protein n=1 Tax=Puccinia striiformis TaxID=27350 RepID=A0A2S4UQD8_9BASI|nr:hypothetical protein PSHT_13521 [Puccinia striiformis]